MPRRLLWACLLPAVCVAPASADLITLKNGRVMEGETETTPEGLWVKRPSGAVLLDLADVAGVESKETPWQALTRRLDATAGGDYGGILEVAFFALDAGLEAELGRVIDKAITEPMTPADADTVRLGLLALERELEPQARALLLHTIHGDPKSPAAALGLQRLDFHWHEGRWTAPEDYYPAMGYVQFEGRWALPEEVRVAETQRALVAARAVAAEADDALAQAERRVLRAQDVVPTAELRVAEAEADVVHARAVLRARAQDLAAADEYALAARFDARAFTPPPCTPACGGRMQPRHRQCAGDTTWIRRQQRALDAEAQAAQTRADDARRERDGALRALEDALACQTDAPRRLAEARSELLVAEATLVAANKAATESQLALAAAEASVQAARRALIAARRG